jgi:hypothetical protein
MRAVREEYAAALEELAAADAPTRPAIAERYGLTEGQGAVLSRAADAFCRESGVSGSATMPSG